MMRKSILFNVVAVLIHGVCAAILQQRRIVDSAPKKVVRQRMENVGDAQYTGVIQVGDQHLKAVMDTGSFELLVLSTNCTVCGNTSHLYNESASEAHRSTGFDAEHSFGSGSTNSLEAFDSLTVGGSTIKQQVFWEVYDAKMSLLAEDTFQAILGIGPPSSAVKFAEEDVDEVHAELRRLKKNGVSITDEVLNTVKHYEDLLEHAQNATSVVQKLQLHNLSVCLGKKSLSDGYIIWNDHHTRFHPDKFVQIDVVGEYYWSAEMTDVKLGGHVFKGNSHLGCKDKPCSAVVDTGTTLIAAPPDVVDRVDALLLEFMNTGGTCDDISKLPDLKFSLGGHLFSLPPESYVGQIKGELSDAVGRYLPHVFARQKSGRQLWGHDCESLLMKIDMDSQSGPLWILGMPLFRKYYTSFHFANGKHGGPQASMMSFAIADDECYPETEASASERLLRTTARKAQLILNASKIRVPRLVSRAVGGSETNSMLFPRKQFVRV